MQVFSQAMFFPLMSFAVAAMNREHASKEAGKKLAHLENVSFDLDQTNSRLGG
jgi:hypothetical protein